MFFIIIILVFIHYLWFKIDLNYKGLLPLSITAVIIIIVIEMSISAIF